MVADPTYLAPGVVLQDRYEIADEIGRGGFSIVYRARDRRVGADVAIKLLVPPPAAARLARERLRREVQAVRQLSHPNIVAVYDVVDDGPWSFVVMEYGSGPDRAVRVRRRGPRRPPPPTSASGGPRMARPRRGAGHDARSRRPVSRDRLRRRRARAGRGGGRGGSGSGARGQGALCTVPRAGAVRHRRLS